MKHFKGLDFCYNSVSTLSLSILSDLDELQQTEFARLAQTLNNPNIVGIANVWPDLLLLLLKCYLEMQTSIIKDPALPYYTESINRELKNVHIL